MVQMLQFVDRRCHCLDAFTPILSRYVKTTLDRQTVVACLIAYGTNVGLGKIGAISDLSYQTLYAAANHFLRPETVHEANVVAKTRIFREQLAIALALNPAISAT